MRECLGKFADEREREVETDFEPSNNERGEHYELEQKIGHNASHYHKRAGGSFHL